MEISTHMLKNGQISKIKTVLESAWSVDNENAWFPLLFPKMYFKNHPTQVWGRFWFSPSQDWFSNNDRDTDDTYVNGEYTERTVPTNDAQHGLEFQTGIDAKTLKMELADQLSYIVKKVFVYTSYSEKQIGDQEVELVGVPGWVCLVYRRGWINRTMLVFKFNK